MMECKTSETETSLVLQRLAKVYNIMELALNSAEKFLFLGTTSANMGSFD